MTSISSFLPSSQSAIGSSSSTARTQTPYEVNAQEFGPAVATAIGVAAQATDVAKSTASFSSEGLKKLSSMVGSAVDSIEGAVSTVGDELSSFGSTIEKDVKKAYGAVADTATSIVSGIEGAVTSVEHTVSNIASSIGDAATTVEDKVASATSSAAGYLALGISVFA